MFSLETRIKMEAVLIYTNISFLEDILGTEENLRGSKLSNLDDYC